MTVTAHTLGLPRGSNEDSVQDTVATWALAAVTSAAPPLYEDEPGSWRGYVACPRSHAGKQQKTGQNPGRSKLSPLPSAAQLKQNTMTQVYFFSMLRFPATVSQITNAYFFKLTLPIFDTWMGLTEQGKWDFQSV